MNKQCKFKVGKYNCGSYAFNLYKEKIDQGDYCDHHYWQSKAQRTWVSLTDDQIKEIVGPWGDTPIKGYTRKLIDQIDAKLRENNNG
jgi:hypothetical protein